MAVGATESAVEFERTPGGAVLMNGNRLRDEIVARLRGEIEAAGSPPVCLATVLVGVDKPSQIYVRSKHKKAEEAGHAFAGHRAARDGVAGRGRRCRRRAGRRSVGARHLVPAPAPRRARRRGRARQGAHRQGRRRADRELDGSPPARPARARRLHTARRDAPARTVRRHDPGQARRGRRPLDARRPADGAAARPQGRRRHGDAGALPHRPISPACAARPTSSSPPPDRPG